MCRSEQYADGAMLWRTKVDALDHIETVAAMGLAEPVSIAAPPTQ